MWDFRILCESESLKYSLTFFIKCFWLRGERGLSCSGFWSQELKWCLKLKASWVNSIGMQHCLFDPCVCVSGHPTPCSHACSLFSISQQLSWDFLLCVGFPQSHSKLWIHNQGRQESQNTGKTENHISSWWQQLSVTFICVVGSFGTFLTCKTKGWFPDAGYSPAGLSIGSEVLCFCSLSPLAMLQV